MTTAAWMEALLVAPLSGAAIALILGRRAAPVVGVVTALVSASASIGLAFAVSRGGVLRYAVGGWGRPLGIDLYVDGLAAVMLTITGVVGACISVCAVGYFAPKPAAVGQARGNTDPAWLFWPLWLMLWGGMNALYLSGDLFNIYVTQELIGLSGIGLIALAGGSAIAAALRYLLLALAGSLFYIVGVELLYAGYMTLDLQQLRERVDANPSTMVAAALMTAGLLAKSALFPLHFWLPPAHGHAPVPVSAALSALVVKTGFYLVVRLWLQILPGLAPQHLGILFGVLGAAAVFWGGVQALMQERLKMMVAYSTVAQVGYLFMLFPVASVPEALPGALLLAASHAAAKAALFMCAGSVLAVYGHDRIHSINGFGARMPLTAVAFALSSISLIGLPPSGGFAGKWMLISAAFAAGAWWWAAIIALGGLLSAVYLFRVLSHAFLEPPIAGLGRAPWGMEVTSLVLALVAIGLNFAANPLHDLLKAGAG
ncbi:MAG: complex I subunit 5 family protein [Hyphomicrobiaceae bacterium]